MTFRPGKELEDTKRSLIDVVGLYHTPGRESTPNRLAALSVDKPIEL